VLYHRFMYVCAFNVLTICPCSYLVAETPFGPYDNPNTRLILIGGDHKTQAQYLFRPRTRIWLSDLRWGGCLRHHHAHSQRIRCA
jgi:hypothetical protein